MHFSHTIRFTAVCLITPFGPLLWSGLAAQATVVTVGGQPLSSEREGFVRVGSVVELPEDSLRVVVQDIGERRIVVVNFRNGNRDQVGRQGDGPREYRNPGRLFPGTDGRPLFQDGRSGKLLRLVENGRGLDELPLDPRKFGSRPLLLGVDQAGRAVIRADGLDGSFADSSAVLSWRPGDEQPAAFARLASGMVTTATGAGGRVLQRGAVTPFAPAVAHVVLPTGSIAVVSSVPYQVSTISPAGVRSAGPIFPWQPIPVTEAERVELAQASARRPQPQAAFGATSAELPRLPSEPIPTTKPPFSGPDPVRVAPDGMIWVAKNRAADDPVPTYDLFNRDGVITKVVRLPEERVLLGFGRGVLFLGRRDPATDLVYLERWPLPRR
ncbi:MAG: hypothetical protein SFU84_12560 [Gemmatimonadales bacterium]|nr:hypothetical protein [Gemmatimonadales bacterium]